MPGIRRIAGSTKTMTKEGTIAMFRHVLFLCAVFCPIPALAIAAKSSPTTTEKDLQGTWQAVDGEGNGGKLDEDKIKETKLVIESNTLGITPDGEGRKTTFTVDSSKTPGTINLIPLDGAARERLCRGFTPCRTGNSKYASTFGAKTRLCGPPSSRLIREMDASSSP
jgi:uncharacterized protein (TIGR03067 family)